jgi:serine/threonine protein kinase
MNVTPFRMNVTLYPFSQNLSKKRTFTSLDDICDEVSQTPENEKPICLLVNEQGITFLLKFGIHARRKFTHREAKVLNELKDFPHVEVLLWWSDTSDTILLIKEYYTGFTSQINTFRQLLQLGSDLQVRTTLFQVLFTLLHVRKKFPGFKHNDLKTDNIIVTQPDSKHSYSLVHEGTRRVWHTCGNTKLIDFESAHAPSFGKQDESELSEEYGITTSESAVFDIHLLFFDCMLNSTGNIRECLFAFATTFIPKQFFNRNELTEKLRLKPKHQTEQQISIESMLCHPYFAHLRGESHESVNYEI